MSDVMMRALQMKVESLTRQVEQLGPENERVRKLLTEFDERHDRDQAEIGRLRTLLAMSRLNGAWDDHPDCEMVDELIDRKET